MASPESGRPPEVLLGEGDGPSAQSDAHPEPFVCPRCGCVFCPRCGRVSCHPRDKQEGYCGACHDWTMPSAENDALARALYEQQGRRNIADGTASFRPTPWGELPEGSRDYWRGQADELTRVIPPEGGRGG